MRTVEVKQGILSKNDRLAQKLRQRFETSGVFALNLVSSPGTGKTELLQRTLSELGERGWKVGALVGDLQTDNDARRLSRCGARTLAEVKPVQTTKISADSLRDACGFVASTFLNSCSKTKSKEL